MLGLKYNTVALADHEPEWDLLAAQTIDMLWKIFGTKAKDIQHIGSTAIRSIKAKPMLDIAVGVNSFNDLSDVFPRLEENGVYKSKNQPLPRIILCSIKKSLESNVLCNLHIVEFDSSQWRDHICFRDYMNAFAEKAAAYEKLKVELAEKYPNDREAYTNGKSEFIKRCISEGYVYAEMK